MDVAGAHAELGNVASSFLAGKPSGWRRQMSYEATEL